jgi:hypothetical protein
VRKNQRHAPVFIGVPKKHYRQLKIETKGSDPVEVIASLKVNPKCLSCPRDPGAKQGTLPMASHAFADVWKGKLSDGAAPAVALFGMPEVIHS